MISTNLRIVAMHKITLLLLPLVLTACTETIPVKPFGTLASVPDHVSCEVVLGGYFHQVYGRKSIDDRATAKLQFTIPEAAFVNHQSDSKVRKYSTTQEADNRIVFYVDGKTQASANITAIQIRDGSRNDSIEFHVASASGKIGYVDQNKNSLFVRLSDSAGIVLSDPNDNADKDRDWTGFIDAKQSKIHLTDDTYRKRTLQTEPFTVDDIKKRCEL